MSDLILVGVFTGTRAEYGLLAPLLRLIQQHDQLELHLIVSGTHLSHLHGYTIEHILADGFIPATQIETVLASDSAQSISKALALTIIDVGAELARSGCDYLVVLGDRFEALAAATAALVHGVPIVHMHGGEASEGATDERFRHAITKLADLHFVAGDEFARRLRQMGEPEERIFVCGPAVQDVLATLTTLDKDALERELGVDFKSPTALLVYHPATADNEDPAGALDQILSGVFAAGIGLVLASFPNADESSFEISKALRRHAQDDERIVTFTSVGQEIYLSLLRECDVLVGNSSSGIIEAPLLGTPTINVGSRQAGRPRASSITDVAPLASEIEAACRRAIGEGIGVGAAIDSPYRVGASMAARVVEVLTSASDRPRRSKPFQDRMLVEE